MKVKIGEKIYDSNEEPIMLILGEDDKYNIEQMHEECSQYVGYPEHLSDEDLDSFMQGAPYSVAVSQKGRSDDGKSTDNRF